MTGRDLADIRTAAGLNRIEFARALGWGGARATVRRRLQRYEETMAGQALPASVDERVRVARAEGYLPRR